MSLAGRSLFVIRNDVKLLRSSGGYLQKSITLVRLRIQYNNIIWVGKVIM